MQHRRVRDQMTGEERLADSVQLAHSSVPTDSFATNLYTQMRQLDPVVRSASGSYLVTGHAEAVQILRSPTAIPFPNASEQESSWNRLAERFFVFLDGTDHRSLRQLVSSPFHAAHLDKSTVGIRALCRDQAATFIRQVSKDGKGDILSSFAVPCSVAVLAQLLQLSDHHATSIGQLSERIRSVVVTGADLDATALALAELSSELLRSEESGIVRQVAASSHDFTTQQATLALIILAGFETSANFAANLILRMMWVPAFAQTIAHDPSLVPAAIDESLRLHSPAHIVARSLERELLVGDVLMPAGSQVSILLHLCNRDPRVFPNPDNFELNRPTVASLAFSHGRHYCLGANLARLELQLMVEELGPYLPAIRLSPANDFTWTSQALGRSLTHLLVEPSER